MPLKSHGSIYYKERQWRDRKHTRNQKKRGRKERNFRQIVGGIGVVDLPRAESEAHEQENNYAHVEAINEHEEATTMHNQRPLPTLLATAKTSHYASPTITTTSRICHMPANQTHGSSLEGRESMISKSKAVVNPNRPHTTTRANSNDDKQITTPFPIGANVNSPKQQSTRSTKQGKTRVVVNAHTSPYTTLITTHLDTPNDNDNPLIPDIRPPAFRALEFLSGLRDEQDALRNCVSGLASQIAELRGDTGEPWGGLQQYDDKGVQLLQRKVGLIEGFGVDLFIAEYALRDVLDVLGDEDERSVESAMRDARACVGGLVGAFDAEMGMV
ncbi:hypothetical protein GQ44DRAFT_771389 [Phaeosphaeriaceae sp. PMI808]|nr:hypothetical protein GQ44DRAFT_771389 [Phaeosphaeriaceae sp. PMI808]